MLVGDFSYEFLRSCWLGLQMCQGSVAMTETSFSIEMLKIQGHVFPRGGKKRRTKKWGERSKDRTTHRISDLILNVAYHYICLKTNPGIMKEEIIQKHGKRCVWGVTGGCCGVWLPPPHLEKSLTPTKTHGCK